MSFIGIITNSKNEEYVNSILSKIFPSHNIIYITEKNITNVRNIKFETVLLDRKIKQTQELKQIISKVNNLILNTDLELHLEILKELDLTVVTYGFNQKATLTPSSVTENSLIICLQRIIKDKDGNKYEPQEIELKISGEIEPNCVLGVFAITLIYGKSGIYLN